MRRLVAIVALLLVAHGFGAPAVAGRERQDRVDYRLRMRDPASHLFEVSIGVDAGGGPVDFQMPAWSPGRYVIYDFARNVQEVGATDEGGRALPVVKLDKQTWRVVPQPGRLTFNYKVYANDLSGTFSQLDARHANVNGPSVFMYVVGRKPSPARLTVEPPKGWGVFNALSTSKVQVTFDAPNYDVLADTPTEAGPGFEVRTFTEGGVEFRVLTHQLGDERSRADRYAADVARVVRAAMAVLGPLDTERYTFLVHFDPDSEPDGMEHLASTQIVRSDSLEDDRYDDLLDVTAHEFFHAWNVKRLRPAELGPWDYTRENYTTSLWIAEGVTSYYADVILLRAGIWTPERFLEALERQVGTLEATPGRRLVSLEQSSFDTWLHIAARARQRTNPVLPLNYYNKGHVVGAMLDLEIRARTGGARSLDDVFRLLYRRFYLEAPAAGYYLKGRGYRAADFLAAVNEVSGSDFSDFFRAYVSGVEDIDYAATLGKAALRISRRRGSAFEIGPAARASEAELAVRRGWLGR